MRSRSAARQRGHAGADDLCRWWPDRLIAAFTTEPAVVAVGALFLHVIAWNFVASGLVYTCWGLVQALGDTRPALLSTATRLVMFVLPLLVLARQPGFRIEHVWYVSVASVTVQALLSLALARFAMRTRLAFP